MKKIYILFLSLFYTFNFSQQLDAELYEINYQSGLDARNLFKYNDQILFAGAQNDLSPGYWNGNHELWTYNFTTKKTTLLKELVPYATSPFGHDPQFLLFKGKSYFLAEISSKYELWETDGTPNGTKKVFGFPDNYVMQMTSNAEKIIITGNKTVYISDGSPAGTQLLMPTEGELEKKPFPFQNYFVFAAKNAAYKNELYLTDGSEAGTFKIKSYDTNDQLTVHVDLDCYILNGQLFFYGGDSTGVRNGLWALDNATKKAKFIFKTNGVNSGKVLNNRLIFFGNTATDGNNLFATDGTAENTKALSSTMHFANSVNEGTGLQILGNSVYFFANTNERSRLWKTDGTAAGTVSTNAVIPDYSRPNFLKYFPENKLLLLENSSHNLFYLLDENLNVTALDQTRLHDAVEKDNKLIFNLYTKKYGLELSQFNPATSEISLLKDSQHEVGSFPVNIHTTAQNSLIFTANDGEFGNQFYTIKNKGELPQVIKQSPSWSSIPEGDFFKVGTYYYVKPSVYTSALAKTNGDGSHTQFLALPQTFDKYATFGNLKDEALIIATYNSYPERTIRVWKNEVGSETIELIREIPTGPTVEAAKSISYKGNVYFTVYTADYKTQIWKTDGTSAGTKIAFDIPDIPYYSNVPRFLQVFDGQLLVAKDNKLWAYNDDNQQVKPIPFPTNDWGYSDWNVSDNTLIDDGKLYILSQLGYGSVFRFNDLQSEPTNLLSANFFATETSFKKCGNQIYVGNGTYGDKMRVLWSINSASGNAKEIINYNEAASISNLTCAKNYLYFLRENDTQVWRTNGTAASTVALSLNVLNEEQIAADDHLLKLHAYDDSLYFVAETKTSGAELYIVKTELPIYLSTGDTANSSKIKLILYPNPASSYINVKGNPTAALETYTVFDMTGKRISAGKYNDQNQAVDISGLSAGNYILEITTKNGSRYSQNFIKK
ncbi:T9SS type A sorting domain-containing protein [Kaistella palustris]|uniref:T9SS type A sorting domain-containing protein n=1 Tax=Kaistella palustris TaxID=493376 RepID=UPI0004063380|nr:T9SS type A sorting domain-containing protein [Kaistella palustris]